MKKYIYGNFKMNTTIKDNELYIEKFSKLVVNSKNEIGIFPPFTNLMFANQKLTSSKILLGAQNVATEEKGAFTGEISAQMLKAVDVRVVLIGHSERRNLFGEKNEIIAKKIKQALSCGLKVVLCVGESKIERSNGRFKAVIKKQIIEALKGLYENELKNIIIAYEPVWAIGTGETASLKQIEEMAEIIKQTIKDEYSEQSSKNIKILYGGSVNSQNAKSFAYINNISGLLVGGASLKPDEFAKICDI